MDDPDASAVTILYETGERYLPMLYDDARMRENQMLEFEQVTAGQLLRRHPEALPPLVSVGAAASLRQAVGSVTEALTARVLDDAKLLDQPVAERMGAPLPVVDSDMPADRLVSLLSKETPLVGIVNRYDALREVVGIG